MIKITIPILLFVSFSCLGQNRVYKKFLQLNYDNAKIFYFNCDTNIDLQKYNLLNDTSLVDSHQKWAYTVSKTNYTLSKIDIQNTLKILKIYYTDYTDSDPSACYTPRMGLVFFKKKLPVAHIDVCLECDKILIEIFDNDGKIVLRKSPSTVGYKTLAFFKSLCKKYKLKGCEE